MPNPSFGTPNIEAVTLVRKDQRNEAAGSHRRYEEWRPASRRDSERALRHGSQSHTRSVMRWAVHPPEGRGRARQRQPVGRPRRLGRSRYFACNASVGRWSTYKTLNTDLSSRGLSSGPISKPSASRSISQGIGSCKTLVLLATEPTRPHLAAAMKRRQRSPGAGGTPHGFTDGGASPAGYAPSVPCDQHGSEVPPIMSISMKHPIQDMTWTSFDRYARYHALASSLRATFGDDASVVDIGDGSGYLQAFAGRPVVSIDLMPSRDPLPGALLVKGSGTDLPFRHDQFDVRGQLRRPRARSRCRS